MPLSPRRFHRLIDTAPRPYAEIENELRRARQEGRTEDIKRLKQEKLAHPDHDTGNKPGDRYMRTMESDLPDADAEGDPRQHEQAAGEMRKFVLNVPEWYAKACEYSLELTPPPANSEDALYDHLDDFIADNEEEIRAAMTKSTRYYAPGAPAEGGRGHWGTGGNSVL